MMTGARHWNFMKNVAILALLSSLNCGGPAHSFDAKQPRPPANRPGRALAIGNSSPRAHGPRPRQHAPYRFVPPRIARLQRQRAPNPHNPRQVLPTPAEIHNERGARGILPAPPVLRRGHPFVKPTPHRSYDEYDHDYEEGWLRIHNKFYLGRLEEPPEPKLPKPPKYSQARHPRLQKALVTEPLPPAPAVLAPAYGTD
ncbi:uncharacterized protein LOC119388883 [Rhipicephalus sanguineus]|uniref:uncharacterized protein LOC119388883 n=1 Tax=Rhipicephalus sanguineus TaxID=34632 RepID=UPI0018931767|nr:uncharacterized protein LOC119388883 [Rhipicephalus sanguineus]